MTTIFAIVAAIVFGIGLVLIMRRRMKKADKLDSFVGKPAPCPSCKTDLVLSSSWKRTGLRGELFSCSSCGKSSWWDFSLNPPKLRAGRVK
jgi:hypothetical protein